MSEWAQLVSGSCVVFLRRRACLQSVRWGGVGLQRYGGTFRIYADYVHQGPRACRRPCLFLEVTRPATHPYKRGSRLARWPGNPAEPKRGPHLTQPTCPQIPPLFHPQGPPRSPITQAPKGKSDACGWVSRGGSSTAAQTHPPGEHLDGQTGPATARRR